MSDLIKRKDPRVYSSFSVDEISFGWPELNAMTP